MTRQVGCRHLAASPSHGRTSRKCDYANVPQGDDKPDGLPLRSAVLRENGRGSSFKERRLLPLYYKLLCRPSHGPQHSPKEPRPDTTTVILIPHSLNLPVSNHTKGWNPLSFIVPPRTRSDVASASCKSYKPQIVSVCCTQTPLFKSLLAMSEITVAGVRRLKLPRRVPKISVDGGLHNSGTTNKHPAPHHAFASVYIHWQHFSSHHFQDEKSCLFRQTGPSLSTIRFWKASDCLRAFPYSSCANDSAPRNTNKRQTSTSTPD